MAAVPPVTSSPPPPDHRDFLAPLDKPIPPALLAMREPLCGSGRRFNASRVVALGSLKTGEVRDVSETEPPLMSPHAPIPVTPLSG